MPTLKNKGLLLKVVANLLIGGALIIYIYINRHSIFGTFQHIKPVYLTLVLIGQLGIQFSNACLLKDTLRPLNVRMGFLESFRLTIAASFINFFTPIIGGVGVRAVYLKRQHNLGYAAFAGITYANYLIIFLISFLCGLLGILSISGSLNSGVGEVVALFFIAGILTSTVFLLAGHRFIKYIRGRDNSNKIITKIIEKLILFDESWTVIRKSRSTILRMFLWSTATMLSVILLYWSAMAGLGIKSSVSVATAFAALAVVGLLLNITPGSIGIREAMYAGIYSITGIAAQQVVAFSLVDRATQIVILVVGWSLFSGRMITRRRLTAPKI